MILSATFKVCNDMDYFNVVDLKQPVSWLPLNHGTYSAFLYLWVATWKVSWTQRLVFRT